MYEIFVERIIILLFLPWPKYLGKCFKAIQRISIS